MWSLTDLADYLGLSMGTMKKRIKRYPPERWAEPVQPSQSRKQKPKPIEAKRLTAEEIERMSGYSDSELFELYQRFRDTHGALRQLADFMASNTKMARMRVMQWQKEGRL